MGVDHKVNSPKNQPQMTMGQYWFAITKPKKLSYKPEISLISCYKNFIEWNFLLTD